MLALALRALRTPMGGAFRPMAGGGASTEIWLAALSLLPGLANSRAGGVGVPLPSRVLLDACRDIPGGRSCIGACPGVGDDASDREPGAVSATAGSVCPRCGLGRRASFDAPREEAVKPNVSLEDDGAGDGAVRDGGN